MTSLTSTTPLTRPRLPTPAEMDDMSGRAFAEAARELREEDKTATTPPKMLSDHERDAIWLWTWIVEIEKELARRKERKWRRAIALGTKLAEESALFTLTMKARQVAELGRHRKKLVHTLKERAWDLAARRMTPGNA